MNTKMDSEIKNRNPLEVMLNPRSVAVVGASPKEGSLGFTVLKKVLDFGFQGEVIPINPRSPEILGKKAYPRLTGYEGTVDLAVICVPPGSVLDVFADCHIKGVKSSVIISAGFKEVGEEGRKREEELKKKIEEYGIPTVGPNCFGIVNTSAGVSLDCTFARAFCQRGRIGFISQSGALGAAVMEDLNRTGMGLSKFISLGNRADIDENLSLEYLGKDAETGIIFIYLENFSNPLKFLEIAQKITPYKPILLLKAGKSASGARAAASHTGMMAQSDAMVSALVEKAGVMRVHSIPEMINAGKSLYGVQNLIKEELAVITNAGGFGVLTVDKAEEIGVKLAEYDEKTIHYLETHLPPAASCHNPVDLLGTATYEEYRHALEGVLSDENVGAVICNFGPPVMQRATPIAEVVVEKARQYPEKPVFSIFMNRYRVMEPIKECSDIFIPQFDYPEDAVSSFGWLLRYHRIKAKGEESYPHYEVNRARVDEIIKKVQSENRKNFNFDEGCETLSAYGIPVVPYRVIQGVEDLKELTLRFPLAVKPQGGEVVHKSDLKALKLNIKDMEELKSAIWEVGENIRTHTGRAYNGGFILQEMVMGSKEVILGAVKQDGGIPLLMFGLGGILVEIMKDVSFGVPPLSMESSMEMMMKIKGFKILSGYRGEKGVCIEDLQSALIRLSMLVQDHPSIREIDINPFMSSSVGGSSFAVDVRIIL